MVWLSMPNSQTGKTNANNKTAMSVIENESIFLHSWQFVIDDLGHTRNFFVVEYFL